MYISQWKVAEPMSCSGRQANKFLRILAEPFIGLALPFIFWINEASMKNSMRVPFLCLQYPWAQDAGIRC